MKIELWDYSNSGIIFPLKTNIVWTNQCGGTSCSHPELEGIFVPLNLTPEGYGVNCLWCDAWGFTYLDYLHEIQAVEDLQGFLGRVSEEEFHKLINEQQCGEAWIPVKIIMSKNNITFPKQLEPFIGDIGIFTYPNSD